MPSVEYEDRELWERYYSEEEAQQEKGLEERSHIEGDEGEETFNQLVLEAAKGQEVIDVGCGPGELTLKIGRVAVEKEKLLARGGFVEMMVREYEAKEYFESVKDVLIRLETTPIIPDLNETWTWITSRKSKGCMQRRRE